MLPTDIFSLHYILRNHIDVVTSGIENLLTSLPIRSQTLAGEASVYSLYFPHDSPAHMMKYQVLKGYEDLRNELSRVGIPDTSDRKCYHACMLWNQGRAVRTLLVNLEGYLVCERAGVDAVSGVRRLLAIVVDEGVLDVTFDASIGPETKGLK